MMIQIQDKVESCFIFSYTIEMSNKVTNNSDALSECVVNADILWLVGCLEWWSWCGLARTCKALLQVLGPLRARMKYRSLRQTITQRNLTRTNLYTITIDYHYPDGKHYKRINSRFILDNTQIRLSSITRYLYAENGRCVQEFIGYYHPSLIVNGNGNGIEYVVWFEGDIRLGGWSGKDHRYYTGDNMLTSRQFTEVMLNIHGVKSFIINYLPDTAIDINT